MLSFKIDAVYIILKPDDVCLASRLKTEYILFLGMDWKSMTIPASLPLTTDYIPEETSLKMDYLMSNYTLLPNAYVSERTR